jgi:hypothetical protein
MVLVGIIDFWQVQYVVKSRVLFIQLIRFKTAFVWLEKIICLFESDRS